MPSRSRAAAAAALALDPWIWHHIEYPGVHDKDWGRLLRVFGSLVLWFPLAVAVWLERRARKPHDAGRAGLLFWGPVVSGGVGELLKMLFRRERPGLHDGESVFRAFSDSPFNTSALGMPSSHTIDAFGGAAILARMFPRTAPVGYLLAAGWAVGALLWNRFGVPRSPNPL